MKEKLKKLEGNRLNAEPQSKEKRIHTYEIKKCYEKGRRTRKNSETPKT